MREQSLISFVLQCTDGKSESRISGRELVLTWRNRTVTNYSGSVPQRVIVAKGPCFWITQYEFFLHKYTVDVQKVGFVWRVLENLFYILSNILSGVLLIRPRDGSVFFCFLTQNRKAKIGAFILQAVLLLCQFSGQKGHRSELGLRLPHLGQHLFVFWLLVVELQN